MCIFIYVYMYIFIFVQSKFQDLRIVNIVGGDGIEDQFDALATHPDIIIATPGRLMYVLMKLKDKIQRCVSFRKFSCES